MDPIAGRVRRSAGGRYEVELSDGEVVEASLRGRLKLEQRTGDRVVVGDLVTVHRHTDGTTTIEGVADRQSQLARRAAGYGGRRAKVIVANVDQVVVVFAAASPAPRLRMLDRFLVLAESNALTAIIVVNKMDLAMGETVAETFRAYDDAGYPIIRTSVLAGEGLAALRQRLVGRISVLTGPSGTGKSSLLNAVEPGLELGTAGIGVAGKGRHTTVTARLIPIRDGGYVADTPGLRELGLWGVPLDTLDDCFPEFRPLLGACRFARSCSHVHEPGCAIVAAVEAREIDRERYDSYRAMRESEEIPV